MDARRKKNEDRPDLFTFSFHDIGHDTVEQCHPRGKRFLEFRFEILHLLPDRRFYLFETDYGQGGLDFYFSKLRIIPKSKGLTCDAIVRFYHNSTLKNLI